MVVKVKDVRPSKLANAMLLVQRLVLCVAEEPTMDTPGFCMGLGLLSWLPGHASLCFKGAWSQRSTATRPYYTPAKDSHLVLASFSYNAPTNQRQA